MNRRYHKQGFAWCLLLAAFVLALPLSADAQGKADGGVVSRKLFENSMRKLWEDHVTWTRLFIVSASSDLPDKEATLNRLLENQVDIGNAVKPFYGDAAGDRLTALLKDHIAVAGEVLSAAKGGQTARLEDATKRWYANANEIADFLSHANPKAWPADDARAMMKEHLDLTTAEVVAHLKGQWKDDVAAYDKVHEAILRMADMLSSGIISQFPKRFS
jgi:acyl-coenzyme A synthetase/AMP-(fatty) acid ligase